MKGPLPQSGLAAAPSRAWLPALSALALSAAAHAQTPRTWSAGSGVWSNPLNWSPNDVPNAPPETAIIGGVSALTISLDMPALLVGASINNASAILSTNPGSVLALGTAGLNTGLVNNGLLRINGAAASTLTQLRFPAGGVISGSGRIQLNAEPSTLDSAFISADPGFSWTHSAGHTISGNGRLYGPLNNAGVIAADQAGKVLQIAGDIQNTGSVGATLGILELAQGARLSGGSLVASPSATVRVVDQAGLANMNLSGQVSLLPGSRLEIGAGALTGEFDLRINDAAQNAPTEAAIVGAATLGGGGTSTTTLNANASDLDSARLTSESGALAIAAGHTIRGTGRIYAPLTGVPTVNANVASRELEVLGDVDMTSGGGLSASASSSLLSIAGQVTLTAGSFGTSAGGVGRIKPFAFATVRGTTLSGSIESRGGSLVRLDSAGLGNAATFVINGAAENVPTALQLIQSAAITGTGNVTLNANSSDLNSAAITGANGVTLTNGAGHTIRGTGKIIVPVSNLGAISANNPSGPLLLLQNVTNTGSGALAASNAILQLGNSMTIAGGSFTSFGTGRLAVPLGETATLNAFQLKSGSSTHVLAGGNLQFTGDLNNLGQIVVNPAGDLQLSRLRAASSNSLLGSGSVILNANAANLDSAMIDAPGFVLTQGAGHTITGQGRIYAPMSNAGLILAGSAGQSLEIASPIAQTTTGRLRAGAGRLALRSGAQITGGELDRTGSGRLSVDGQASAGSTRSATPIDVLAGSIFTLNDFTNDSDLVVNPTSGAGTTKVVFPGTQSLVGTGNVILSATSQPATRARLDGPTAPNLLTLAAGQTLRGSGTVGGNVLVLGVLSPGQLPTGTGQIIFEEALQLGPAITFDFNLAGPADYDSIAFQKPYFLSGQLKITLTGGYNPSSVHQFLIVDGAPGAFRTGGFTSFNLPSPPVSPVRRVWRLGYQPEDVTLRLTCAADFNADGFVNDLDFEYFQFAYNELLCPTPDNPLFPLQPEPCPADLNQDGFVLDDDFVLFVQAYNLVVCQ